MKRFAVLIALFAAYAANGQCLLTWDTTSTPGFGGVGTTYPANDTVEICFSVNTWNSASANWFHGFEIILGAGWDAGSVNVTALPASCDGNGNWAWYPTITSSATGATFGQGIYYDSGSGGPLDGNPGNNYGDFNTCPAPHWVSFCFTVATPPPGACVEGADLSITLNTLGDGEAGSWSSLNCNLDPNIVFSGPTLTCCEPPMDTVINPVCPGGTDGRITAYGNTSGPYTFDWSTGFSETTPDSSALTGLAAGTYTLVMTDGSGCASTTTYTLTEPPAITFSLDSLVDVACPGGATGQFGVTAFGGSTGLGTFTYSLDGGPDQPIGFFDGLAAGTYTVTARDGNGCTKDTTITLIEDNLLELVVVDVTDALCHGDATGAITLSASGGTPPYTFSADGATYLPGPVLGGLPGGDYTVSVQDATGCVVTAGATVGQPEPLTLDAGTYLPIPSGGDVVLEPVTNADPVASWAWSPADFLSCSDCPNPVSQPDATIWYTLTVTDGNGCTATDSTRIVVVESLAIPNAFTPNADGLNDVFRVQPAYAESFTLRVFNRWGEAVFVSFDPAQGWDGTLRGKEQESGTYLYAVSYVNESGETITRQGTLTLLR
jgi:gliding motility-associated-like protein